MQDNVQLKKKQPNLKAR